MIAPAPSGRAPARFPLRPIAAAALLVLLAALFLVLRGGAPAVEPPTLLLLTLDSTRADHLGLYAGAGTGRGTSPRLDELAREARVFEGFFTASHGTNPALASLMTGLHPASHGLHSIRRPGPHRLRPSCQTLAEILRDRGWRTLAAVSLPQLAPGTSGLGQGFERVHAPPADAPTGMWTAEELLESAGEDIAELLASDQPAFLWIHLAEARVRPGPPAPETARFLEARLGPFRESEPRIAEALDLVGSEPEAALDLLRRTVARSRGRPEKRAWEEALYDGRMVRLDGAAGAVLDLLEADRHIEGACVVAVGTQGENLGEGGRFGGHGGLDRAVALVPLILRAPHGAGAGRIRGTATGADLLPTLMRVLGLEPIEGLDGVPFPTESADAPRVAVCEANDAEEVGLFSGDLAWVRLPLGLPARDPVTGAAVELPSDWAISPDPEGIRAGLEAARAIHSRTSSLELRLASSAACPIELDLLLSGERPWELHAAEGIRPGTSRRISHRLAPAETGAEGSLARIVWAGEAPGLRLSLGLPPELSDGPGPAVRSVSPEGAPALHLALDHGEAWPERDGVPAPPQLDVERSSGRWLRAELRGDGGQEGLPARLCVLAWTSDGSVEPLEARPGPGARMERPPGRIDAAWVHGPTPLAVEIEKRGGSSLAFAAVVEDRPVPASRMRYRGRRIAPAGRLVLLLPDWLPGVGRDLELVLPAGEEGGEAAVQLTLRRRDGALPADAWSTPAPDESRLLERLEDSE